MKSGSKIILHIQLCMGIHAHVHTHTHTHTHYTCNRSSICHIQTSISSGRCTAYLDKNVRSKVQQEFHQRNTSNMSRYVQRSLTRETSPKYGTAAINLLTHRLYALVDSLVTVCASLQQHFHNLNAFLFVPCSCFPHCKMKRCFSFGCTGAVDIDITVI